MSPSTTDATGDGRLREVGPTMAFATGVSEVETMACVKVDYSIDQERAICFRGLFFAMVRVFHGFAFVHHAGALYATRRARRTRTTTAAHVRRGALQALTLTELPECDRLTN